MGKILTSSWSLSKHMAHNLGNLLLLGKIGIFFFSSRRRHTRCSHDWSSDVCSSDLIMSLSISLEKREKDFIDACVARERWAQKQLYEDNYSLLMGVCLRYSTNQDDALDILHEIGRASCRKECRSGWTQKHERKEKRI